MTADPRSGPGPLLDRNRPDGDPAEVPPAAGTAPATPARTQRRHLHQVDVVRLLTFGCVILVHTVSHTNAASSGAAGAVLVLFHFTREAFFFLSSYVLFYATGDRAIRPRTFWARRFFYIGVPYVVWTVVYWLKHLQGGAFTPSGLGRLGFDLVSGTAAYHLYFLLVSMQLYLVFPLFLWLVRRTAGHHTALFVVSLVLQVALLAALQWTHWHGIWAGLQAQAYVLLPTYQFYFVAGALAAVHHERFHRWVVTHGWTVVGSVVGMAAVAELAYAWQSVAGLPPDTAAAPLQPVMIPESLAVTVGIYALGCVYADRRRGGWISRAVAQGSLASFGVYLLHPLVLDRLLAWWLGPADVPALAATVIAWLCTVLLSFSIVAVVIRTPLALPLTGRRRLRPGAPASAGA